MMKSGIFRVAYGTTLVRSFARLALAGSIAAGAMVGSAWAQEKVLTVANPFAPTSLDPGKSAYGRGGTMLLPAYEPLVRMAEDGTMQPGLATAWEVAPDSKSATFTLRDNAKFSDGEPVTAEAAKRSILYWVSAKGPLAANLSTLDTIDVLDAHTFRINLKQPNPAIISMFTAFSIAGDLISPKALDKPENMLNQTFGAGPYMLDPAATVSGKSYTYIPNPHYYDKSAIHYDKMVISVFEDANSAIQAMQAGQLNVFISDAFTGNANRNVMPPTIHLVSSPMFLTALFLWDRSGEVNKALGDVRVRQALNYAIDRKLINDALFGDLGRPTAQMQAIGFPGFDEANENRYPYDVEKAKALLAEAGYAEGLEVKIGYIDNTLLNRLFEVIADQFGAIGVKAVPVPYPTVGAGNQGMAKKEIDGGIYQHTGGIPNSVAKNLFDPKQGVFNPYHSYDADLDALYQKALTLPLKEAEGVWKELYARAVDQGWFVPIANSNLTYFVSNDVDLQRPGATGISDLSLAKPKQ